MKNVQSCPLNFIWLSNGVIRTAGADLSHFLRQKNGDKPRFLFSWQLTKSVKNSGLKYVRFAHKYMH